MIDAFIDSLQAFPRGLVFVAEGLIVLLLAKLAKDAVTRNYRVDEEITTKANLAVALRLSGYFIAIILVFLGVLYQPLTGGGWASLADAEAAAGFGFNREFGEEVLRVFLYSLAGIVALNLVRVLFDRLILYKFHLEKEVVEDRNVGAGAAEFGMYVATGLLIAGAVAGDTIGGGEGKAALVALAFFGMGLVLLIAFALFYEFTTPFDIHDEIERDNPAVGIALGGNLIAIGLVTLKAVFGGFVGWGESIAAFLVFGVLGFVLLYVMRLLIDLVLLPTVRVSQALSAHRNVGVAFVESAVVISSAMILFMAI
jgi:uncharacterized membrane protein YjfL (UPF0719 family)